MPRANAQRSPSAQQPLNFYSPPRLTKLNFSAEQIARIEAAPDRAAELAKVYRDHKGR